MSSPNQSYQLPDILGIISSLELRTNRHCRFATDASEGWLSTTPKTEDSSSSSQRIETKTNGILTTSELSYLRSTKIGLLCALCFPTCDAPQLRVLTDFVTLLFYSVLRETVYGSTVAAEDGQLRKPDTLVDNTSGNAQQADLDGFTLPQKHDLPKHIGDHVAAGDGELRKPPTQIDNSLGNGNAGQPLNGFDLLQQHDLFKHILDRRLLNLSSTASELWKTRFHKSVSDFHAAHAQIRARTHVPNPILQEKEGTIPIPSLEEYIPIARELHGASMVLDLAELMEVFRFPDSYLQESKGRHTPAERMKLITQLRHAALDVIAWSMDVVSYQHSQTLGSPYNLITILMHQNALSVQGAMNLSGNMIRQAFSSFCSAERDLVESLDNNNNGSKFRSLRSPVLSLSWAWNALGLTASSSFSSHSSSSSFHPHPNPHPQPQPQPPSESPSTPQKGNGQLKSEGISESESFVTKRYIRALKDVMVGIVHWAYETELFFGKKGGEIRTFGWVFADQLPGFGSGRDRDRD